MANLGVLVAQSSDTELKDTISFLDAKFWQSYNACNVDGMAMYLSDDVEFYHDKGGLLSGKEALIHSLKFQLCGNTEIKLIRKEVPGSVEVFPLAKEGKYYGAIISGSHVFYLKKENEGAKLDGRARFNQLWLKKT